MYIGEKKIKSNKNGLVEYEDGMKEKFSKEYSKYFTTEEKKDLDAFRIYKTHKIIHDIMKIFIDSSTTMAEIGPVIEGLHSSIENAKDEAVAKLFKVEFPTDIKFSAINDIVLDKK